MRVALPNKRRHWIVLGVVVPVLTVLFLVSGVFQWSPLNCWHEEIDLNSGRVRRTSYLLYCQVGDRTEETWLSRARGNSNAPPDWRRVNTFSPGVHYSPHYRFHGAIHQVNMLEGADDAIPFNPDARRQVADTLLSLWQIGDSYTAADEFVDGVARTAIELQDQGASTVQLSDLPDGS